MRTIHNCFSVRIRVFGSYRNFASFQSLARFLCVPRVVFLPNENLTGWDCWACNRDGTLAGNYSAKYPHIAGRLACVPPPRNKGDMIRGQRCENGELMVYLPNSSLL